MKYIIVECTVVGQLRQFPFIFSDHMVHAEMEKAAAYAISMSIAPPAGLKTIAAGELSSMCLNGCTGESSTLKVKSRKIKDDHALRMHDYTHGHL